VPLIGTTHRRVLIFHGGSSTGSSAPDFSSPAHTIRTTGSSADAADTAMHSTGSSVPATKLPAPAVVLAKPAVVPVDRPRTLGFRVVLSSLNALLMDGLDMTIFGLQIYVTARNQLIIV
jgi:hypothetical protein